MRRGNSGHRAGRPAPSIGDPLNHREPCMSVYRHHVFFCTNRREDGEQCCSQFGSEAARDYMKKRCKALGIHGHGQVRVNTAGCMDRCDKGPVIVIYPEGTWYTFVDQEDLDEIIDRHLRKGEVVERLKI
jgi:(2Fe-2S) ferredoxin